MAILGKFENTAILSGIESPQDFRIKESSTAFSILSSGLYSNKIKAIIRELSCNAHDGHVAVDKARVPFSVHLPNLIEPYFSIRDYGIGLSHDDVVNIFTVYFESSKSGSNDFIGALGLGCKSPLSYTDNFTVTAIKDNIKNIYSVFISDQGTPSIALLDSSFVSEETGVEIAFAVVDLKDIEKFSIEAMEIYRYFPVKPIITGADHIVFVDREYSIKDIIKGVHVTSTDSPYIIMGNIRYPLNIPNKEIVMGELEYLCSCPLEINVAIGELDFQASREALSYSKRTLETLRNKFQDIHDSLYSKLVAEINSIDGIWQKVFFLRQRLYKTRLWDFVIRNYIIETNFNYIDKTFNISENFLAEVFNIKLKILRNPRNNKPEKLSIARNITFITNDTGKGFLEKIKYNYKGKCFYIYCLDIFDEKKPVLYNEFFRYIDNPPLEQIKSSIELRDISKNRNEQEKTHPVLILDPYRKTFYKDGDVLSYSDKITYYYLPLTGNRLYDKFINIYTLCGIYNTGIFRTLGVDTIYGIPKRSINYIKDKSNWINLEDYLRDQFANITLDQIRAKVLYRNVRFLWGCLLHNENIEVLDGTSFYEKIKFAFFNDERQNAIAELYLKLTAEKDYAIISSEVTTLVKEINQKYPLLEYCNNNNISHIIDYIKLIDLNGVK